jgi:hypothetical protein
MPRKDQDFLSSLSENSMGVLRRGRRISATGCADRVNAAQKTKDPPPGGFSRGGSSERSHPLSVRLQPGDSLGARSDTHWVEDALPRAMVCSQLRLVWWLILAESEGQCEAGRRASGGLSRRPAKPYQIQQRRASRGKWRRKNAEEHYFPAAVSASRIVSL